VDVLRNEALLRAPRLVVRLAADSTAHFGLEICAPAFYEGTPDSEVVRVTAKAIAALRGVSEPELQKTRDACLASIPAAH
jgi:hypothetical protein